MFQIRPAISILYILKPSICLLFALVFWSTGMVQEGMMPTLAMSIMEARGLRGTWKYKRPSRGNARRFTM